MKTTSNFIATITSEQMRELTTTVSESVYARTESKPFAAVDLWKIQRSSRSSTSRRRHL